MTTCATRNYEVNKVVATDGQWFDNKNGRENTIVIEQPSGTSRNDLPWYQRPFHNCCYRGVVGTLKKYFWEGQSLNNSQQEAKASLPLDASFTTRLLVNHRRLLGIAIPVLFYWFGWFSVLGKWEEEIWDLFGGKGGSHHIPRYYISITMIFGSMVAGMTSEGGGAVAFPVMTLAFGIAPGIARDFSLMIQSCGMTAAMFTIFWMRINVEWHSIIYCSLGATLGMVIGLEFVDPVLNSKQKKLGFVSIWFAFAFALFLLNLFHKRRTFIKIPNFNWWKAILLIIVGFAGGIFSAVAGSGVDICSFSILTLLFRVSEKTATPTSVVLMAVNTVVGFYWRGVVQMAIEQATWEYLAVCVPIVVVGAPLGSIIGSHFHRLVLAALIYILDTVALVSGFVILKPDLVLGLVCAGIIVGGGIFFGVITFVGHMMLANYEAKERLTQTLELTLSENGSNTSSPPPYDSITKEEIASTSSDQGIDNLAAIVDDAV